MKTTWIKLVLLFVLATMAVVLWASRISGPTNGFDLSNSLIQVDEIYKGGPPRDGIPSIDQPKWISAHSASHMKANDRILGLSLGLAERAYPVDILNWHEIVNDHIESKNILISYCPLCATGMAFQLEEKVDKEGFGVSGLLYQSDMLLYDRKTESLWSQISKQAISGPRVGERLEQIPLEVTNWSDWLERHPRTLVLSRDTGYHRDYDRSPYGEYDSSYSIYFPVSNTDSRYHPKEQVIGLELDGSARVWPFSELAQSDSPIRDQINGININVYFDESHHRAWIENEQGEQIPVTVGYWFAWMAFYPNSSLFQAK